MTINTVIQYINLALNYPALEYADVNLFFDMAIAELNTTLHTSIPKVSDMIKSFERKMSKVVEFSVSLDVPPENYNYSIPSYSTEGEASVNVGLANTKIYYVFSTGKFYVRSKFGNSYSAYDNIKGIYIDRETGKRTFYESCKVGDEVFWVKSAINNTLECDIGNYLPDDWVLLWLVPYVCFKYTCRDGGTSATFADELTQGFQQLQETYSVPSKVILATYADKEAYTELVEANLPNLNIQVPTLAIYENMKHGRALNATYGSIYDRGGFND